MIQKALSVFPDRLKKTVMTAAKYLTDIFEIRLIADVSVYFFTKNGIRFVDRNGNITHVPDENTLRPLESELDELIDRAIGFSGFSHEKELENGFITYAGAIRMGICSSGGKDSFSAGRVSSVSIRIPCSDSLSVCSVPDSVLLDFNNGLLVAGAPGCGKTTLLRNIARKLSDGMTGEYKKVCVIDERGELSGNEVLGSCTDVIKGKSKALSIWHALRLMSPQYMICDEIGSLEETKAVLDGLNSGVSFVASMHARSITSLIRRKQFRILFDENVFDKVIFLSASYPGKVERVFSYGEITDEIHRTYGSLRGT